MTVLDQTTFPIAADGFEHFLSTRNEPEWLLERRRGIWQQFEQLPWPNNRDEEWMRTDIRLFKLNRFSFPERQELSPPSVPRALLSEGVELAGSAERINSFCRQERPCDQLHSQGGYFGSLENVWEDERLAGLVRPLLENSAIDPGTDRFAALHAAIWHGGTLLYVPRGVQIEEPFHTSSILGANGVDLTKTIVILDENASATLLAETASLTPNDPAFHCGAIELHVGTGARLRYVNLQNWNHNTWHFAHQKGIVGRGGSLQWTIGALGAKLAKVNQHVVLRGREAEAQVNGVMFTEERQHLSYHTLQHHEAESCRSDLLYKTALQDRSRTVWRGMIRVDEAAQRTDAYQRNDNLMLSTEVRADSIPGLEIEADDVRCTHGSTSGHVDDEQVFYAMTRGYTRKEAIRMIVAGFFQQVFDRITLESVREALGQAIGQRVREISEELSQKG